MKRDINFIKHIKSQLKEKEATDKAVSRDTKYRRVCERIGIPQPSIPVEDLGLIASALRYIKGKKEQ